MVRIHGLIEAQEGFFWCFNVTSSTGNFLCWGVALHPEGHDLIPPPPPPPPHCFPRPQTRVPAQPYLPRRIRSGPVMPKSRRFPASFDSRDMHLYNFVQYCCEEGGVRGVRMEG